MWEPSPKTYYFTICDGKRFPQQRAVEVFFHWTIGLGHPITNRLRLKWLFKNIRYLSNLNRDGFGLISLQERTRLDYWKMPKWLVLSIEGHNHDQRSQTGLFKPNWLTILEILLRKNKIEACFWLYRGFISWFATIFIYSEWWVVQPI